MRPFLRHLVLFLALLVFGVPVMTFLELPWPWKLSSTNPEATSFMRYREREALEEGRTLTIRQDWVPLPRIPRDLVRSVLISEDDRFRQHHGIDWKALATDVDWSGGPSFSWTDPGDWAALCRAVRYVSAHRHQIKGRSTITQQLAKNLYFTPKRSFVRKIDEAVVAKRLEWFLSKDRILELYLNTAELGPGVFGVRSAARYYFDEPVQALDRFQAASLAATLPHPLTSNPAHRPGRMAWRRNLILERLLGRDVVIPAEPPSIEVQAQPLVEVMDDGAVGRSGGSTPDSAADVDSAAADSTPSADSTSASADSADVDSAAADSTSSASDSTLGR